MGGKAFCAGGDVKSLYEARQKKDIADLKILDNFFREEYILDNAIRKMKPLQISAYEGIVMGGGVGLSIYSKAKIATNNSLFAMPGLFPLYFKILLNFNFNRG
jgi:enoyl-CoA hydratase/carnithine racemase